LGGLRPRDGPAPLWSLSQIHSVVRSIVVSTAGTAYYICRAVKPSTALAAAEVSDDEAAIEPVYRIAAE
jgi:hypothetical protein